MIDEIHVHECADERVVLPAGELDEPLAVLHAKKKMVDRVAVLIAQSDLNHSRSLVDSEFVIERGANVAPAH